jgi:hypothetical protein
MTQDSKMRIGHFDNIKDIAPTLVFHLIENEETFAEFESGVTEFPRKIEGFIPLAGMGDKYFTGHLHDSPILSIKVENNDLSLIVNDFTTLQFACALIDKKNLKIDKDKLIFPFEMKTEETEHLSLNTVDDNGKIHESKCMKLKEYLHEEIIEWTDDNIEMAFDLWSGKESYLLLVKCKRIKFIENQDKYWKKYFRDEFNHYYDYFVNERNDRIYLSDYSLCERLINTIDRINDHQDRMNHFRNNLIEKKTKNNRLFNLK